MDDQFALDAEFKAAGRLALLGMGADPGTTNIYAAYARRLACELDEARDPAGMADDTDETIDRPPATADDDPAPAEPVRHRRASRNGSAVAPPSHSRAS